MPIQEKHSALIIDVKGTTKTNRHTFSQDSSGNFILESKKIFDNVDFDLKVDGNTKIKIPLRIEAVRDIVKTSFNNFDLKSSNSSLMASVNFSDNVDDTGTTVTEAQWRLLKQSGSGIINLISTFSDSTPTFSYPVTRNIYSDALNQVSPILTMNISDAVKKRFFLLDSTIPLNISDATPSFSFVNNFVLRPLYSYPGTNITLNLSISEEKQPDNIDLNYYKVMKYNSSGNNLIKLDIDDKNIISSSIGGLTHTMKVANDDSITLSMRIEEGGITYLLASTHALAYATNTSITLGLSIFDWMRTPVNTYRYQGWLDN